MARKKSTAIKKATVKKVVPKGASTTEASFSLTFEVSEKKFTVTMSDITNIVKSGLELELPESVALGTFNDFYQWLGEKFSLNLPDLSDVPVVKQFMTGNVQVMTFYIKTPGTEDKSQKYDVDIKITFTDPISIVGTLKLDEVEFGVKYEQAS